MKSLKLSRFAEALLVLSWITLNLVGCARSVDDEFVDLRSTGHSVLKDSELRIWSSRVTILREVKSIDVRGDFGADIGAWIRIEMDPAAADRWWVSAKLATTKAIDGGHLRLVMLSPEIQNLVPRKRPTSWIIPLDDPQVEILAMDIMNVPMPRGPGGICGGVVIARYKTHPGTIFIYHFMM